MRVGKRLFPYPVLNSEVALTAYDPNSLFKLEYCETTTETHLILDDVFCQLKSKFLENLIKEEKAEIWLVVECSQALYRKSFELSLTDHKRIEIPLTELCGEYIISAFIVAKEDFEVDGDIKEFDDVYHGLTFKVEKRCILAVDASYSRGIEINEPDDIRKSSIFTIAPDNKLDDDKMTYSFNKDIINIYLGKKSYDAYYATRFSSQYTKIYIGLMAVPVLTSCIQKLVLDSAEDPKNITEDDLNITSYRWYVSFCNVFSNTKKHIFGPDDFAHLNEVVQELFAYPIGESIQFLSKPNGKEEAQNEN